ncbi:MAG: HAMP domain-containing histidine kinase [Lachnospiraceae bacterium]|nr:HAMP domain-containing histidine kinase [Lachnospiraceae bacterium]
MEDNALGGSGRRHVHTGGGWLVLILLCAVLATVTVSRYPWIIASGFVSSDDSEEATVAVSYSSAEEKTTEATTAAPEEETTATPEEETLAVSEEETVFAEDSAESGVLTVYAGEASEGTEREEDSDEESVVFVDEDGNITEYSTEEVSSLKIALLQACYLDACYNYWQSEYGNDLVPSCFTDSFLEAFRASDWIDESDTYDVWDTYFETLNDVTQETLTDLEDSLLRECGIEWTMEPISTYSLNEKYAENWAEAAVEEEGNAFALWLEFDSVGSVTAYGILDGNTLNTSQTRSVQETDVVNLLFSDTEAGYFYLSWSEEEAAVKAPTDIVCKFTSSLNSCYLFSPVLTEMGSTQTVSSAETGQQAWLENMDQDRWFMALILVVAFCLIVLLAACIFLPFWRALGINESRMTRIPLELNAVLIRLLIALGGFTLFVGLNITFAMGAWQLAEEVYLFSLVPQKLQEPLLFFANGLLLFVLYLGCAIAFLSLRRVFVIGPLRYLKEQTVTGFCLVRLIRWLRSKRGSLRRWFAGVRRGIRRLARPDFSPGDILRIALPLAVNFLVLVLLLFLVNAWVISDVAGLLLMLLYTLALFVLLLWGWLRIRTWYRNIYQGLHDLSSGHLSAEISDDVGLFRPLKEELETVQSGFSRAVEEEVKSQRMKTELITNVSHDLKTPLTAIITYIKLLQEEGATEEERKEYVNILDRKSQRLKQLIEDLFEISKATSGNIPVRAADLELTDLIRQVVLENEEKLTAAQVSLRLRLPEEKVYAHLDGEKLCRILENLISNVAKYGMPGTRAYFSLRVTPERRAVIEVKNVSAAELTVDAESLTERFVRGDASRNTEGSGLGLAIVRSFTEIQGGTFKVRVDADLFTAVVTLPLYAETRNNE